ncbi:MAG: hypothetical protein WCR06_04530 [bacterium]
MILACTALCGCYDRYFPPYVVNSTTSDVRVQTDSPPSDITLAPGGVRLSSVGQPLDYSRATFRITSKAGACMIPVDQMNFSSNALFMVTERGVDVYDTRTLPGGWEKRKTDSLKEHVWRSFEFKEGAEQQGRGYSPPATRSVQPTP